jgi:hypothetical protein
MPLLSGLKKKNYVRISILEIPKKVYLNHHEVYETEEQAEIEGLEILPVQVILNRIASVFSKWEKVDDQLEKQQWSRCFSYKNDST